MAGSSGGSTDLDSQSDDNSQVEKLHLEPIFIPFVCPLTKQVMRDPVTIENGNTFEREAIEKWFKECNESGRKPTCPLTLKDLKSTDLNPSIALRETIEEWKARNEAAQLDMARKSLSPGTSERDILQALRYVDYVSKGSKVNKHAVHNPETVQAIVESFKTGSKKVRCKALETLRIIAEQDSDMKELMGEGGTVRTMVKILSHEQSSEKEKEEVISLLYELSKSQNLSEIIGSVGGAILILIGKASSNLENSLIIEKAHQTLVNLAQSETNVRIMAENGRLQPLLTLLLEVRLGTLFMEEAFGSAWRGMGVKVCPFNIIEWLQIRFVGFGAVKENKELLQNAGMAISLDNLTGTKCKDIYGSSFSSLPCEVLLDVVTLLASLWTKAAEICKTYKYLIEELQ